MPKRPNPVDSLKLDATTSQGVREDYRHLLKALEVERKQFGWRRFTEIDGGLGRRPGFMAKVLSGHESLTVDRLIALLALLGRSLREFVDRFWAPDRIPASPSAGYLASYFGSLKSVHRELRKTSTWVSGIGISPSGTPMTFDPEFVIREAKNSTADALALAQVHLALLMRVQPSILTPESARSLCRLLAAMAHVHRHADQLEHAAFLIDLAFEVESKIDSVESRGLLYRESAYLLSHLGVVRDAEQCAQKAVELALASPTARGLGESLYARAVMVKWQGEASEALRLLAGALPHLRDAAPLFRQAAILESVWLYADLGELDRALGQLNLLSKSAHTLAPLHLGKYRFALAVVHSKRGDQAVADENFDAAEVLIRENGTSTDEALLLLRRCRHELRFGRRVANLAPRLTRLASRMRAGSSCEAALLEVSRSMLAEEIESVRLTQSIRTLERPWAQQPRAQR